MKSVICSKCGGNKRISDKAKSWQCQYCGATHIIPTEEKITKKKVKPKLEEEDVRIKLKDTASDWRHKEEE